MKEPDDVSSFLDFDVRDAVASIGLCLVFVGVAMIHVPAALIVLGLALIGFALRSAVR